MINEFPIVYQKKVMLFSEFSEGTELNDLQPKLTCRKYFLSRIHQWNLPTTGTTVSTFINRNQDLYSTKQLEMILNQCNIRLRLKIILKFNIVPLMQNV